MGFFRHLFSKIEQNHPYIYLKGILHTDLLALMDYIYNGETKVGTDDLHRFIDAAEELKIKGLCDEGIGGHSVARYGAGMKENNQEQKYKPEDIISSACKPEKAHSGDSTSKPMNVGEQLRETPTVEEAADIFIDGSSIPEITFEDAGTFDSHQKWRFEISRRLVEVKDSAQRRMWKCTECGKIRKSKFKQESHIETHIKELGLFSFNCNNCDKICKTKPSLNQHMNIHHRGEIT